MKKSERGFLFFYDWREAFEQLSAKDFKKMFFAMMDYQEKGGEIPEFKGIAEVVSRFVFPQIERRKFISEVNKRNIEKRWNGKKYFPKTDSSISDPYYKKDTEDASDLYYKDKAKVKDKNSDNKKENKKEKNTDTYIDIPPKAESFAESGGECDFVFDDNDYLTPKGGICDDQKEHQNDLLENFGKFWLSYPKKWGGKEALAVFMKIDPDEALMEKILCGLEAQKKSNHWKVEDGRYIPMPSKWLSECRWEKVDVEKEESQIEESQRLNDEMWDSYFQSLYKTPPKCSSDVIS